MPSLFSSHDTPEVDVEPPVSLPGLSSNSRLVNIGTYRVCILNAQFLHYCSCDVFTVRSVAASAAEHSRAWAQGLNCTAEQWNWQASARGQVLVLKTRSLFGTKVVLLLQVGFAKQRNKAGSNQQGQCREEFNQREQQPPSAYD